MGRMKWGLGIPRTLASSQHQGREVGGGAGLEEQSSSVGPLQSPTPHTHPVWAQVWDGNSSNKLGHPQFPGRGSRGGGWGKGKGGSCQLPTGCCLHPSDELALGFPAFSPGQVCQRCWLAPAWLWLAFNALALLDLGTRREAGRGGSWTLA